MTNAKTMAHLRAAAARLKAEADGLGDLILDFERQLADAGVEVRLWLERMQRDGPWFKGWLVDFEERRDQDRGTLITAQGWQIGYTQIGSEWRVAARHVFAEWWNSYHHAVSSDGQCIPLLKAPRQVRVAAFGLLDGLADALAHRMQRYADAIADMRE